MVVSKISNPSVPRLPKAEGVNNPFQSAYHCTYGTHILKKSLRIKLTSTRRYLCFILIVMIFTSCQKNETITSSEDFEGLIPFRSFLQRSAFFISSNTELIVLKNKADEQAFSDTIRTIGSKFPEFSYKDSMLVGIILGEEPDAGIPAGSSDSFSIDSLIAFSDTIAVYSHLFLPKLRLEDVLSPCHFVAIEETDNSFRMMEIVYIYEDPY